MGKNESIYGKIKNETMDSNLSNIQYSAGILSQSNNARERKKEIQLGKEEVKYSYLQHI
jgi:hypothetical protein